MRCSVDGVSVEGPLPEAEVREVWPKAEEFIAQALEWNGNKANPRDVLCDVAEGLLGLYAIRDDETGELLGVVACESQEHPNEDVFNIAYCGGRDLYRWAGLLGALESEAVRLGCQTVRITGRKGWGRVFPDYEEVHRVYERKVIV